MLLVLSPVEHAWFRRSRVIAGIARSRSHRSYWNHCNCSHRSWSLASCVVAGIACCCWHRSCDC